MDKALTAIAAAAALAAAAVISVVSAAFALYAGVSPWLGPAWAAAIVAAAAALLVLLGGLLARSRAHGERRRSSRDQPADASLVEKIVEMAKEHPLVAAGAAVGVGVYALRNPQLVAAVVTAFMAGREEPK